MSVMIYAPATVANIGAGFDLLGVAVAPVDGSVFGDIVEVDKAAKGIELICEGPWKSRLPDDVHENIVFKCAEGYLAKLPQALRTGLRIRLKKNLPVSSGLGSSASSVVAATHALNNLFGIPFNTREMLLMMGEFEGMLSGSVHYDNVAPCYLGGMQLMLKTAEKFCGAVPAFAGWFWVVAYSGASIETAKMRQLLPDKYSKSTMIDYGRYLSGFIHASHKGDSALAAAMIHDVAAEPWRREHIPGYSQAKEAMKDSGMLASGISGSGPTIFAVTDDLAVAEMAAKWLKTNYMQQDGGFVHICRVDDLGSRQLVEERAGYEVL